MDYAYPGSMPGPPEGAVVSTTVAGVSSVQDLTSPLTTHHQERRRLASNPPFSGESDGGCAYDDGAKSPS